MSTQMSPGVQVNEIDLSIVVPVLGNATAAFAGVFTKGPSDKYLLITNPEELIQYYGMPTNDNYNDWFQCYNFLQYANKLLVSRAVDANGTFTEIANTVKVVNEIGKVEVNDVPTLLKAGSVVKFDINADITGEYKIKEIEAPVEAVAQVSKLSVTSDLADGESITFNVNGIGVAYTASGDQTKEDVALALANEITSDANDTTATAAGADITITASTAGVETIIDSLTGNISAVTIVTENVPGESYELVFDDSTDFSAITAANGPIYIKDSAMNALVDAPVDATYDANGVEVTPAGTLKSGDELKPEALFIPNEETYEVTEMSIPVYEGTKLKFFAKSSGSLMNKIEIAIAREKDFASGKSQVFEGLYLNDFFETKPLDSKSEIAIIVRKDGKITGSYIVSTIPGSKDYRNKSNYVEDIINKYDELLYVKDNTATTTLPQSRIFLSVGLDNTVVDNQLPLKTANGTDGQVNHGDIELAYGTVADNTIFGNKEEVDIDIVIANEQARVAAGALASERGDCIAFIGAKFEDVVGLPSAKIVENLIADALNGELNNASTANSYCATFGNYKYQYDKYNDKFRWVSIAGDVAGLRADTNTSLNTWWASAGLDRGQIKNAQKIAFNPNLGQRDFLYKNKINPVVSFPGQGNAIVWGQKTLQSKPSAFDRINVRGLFNTLERAISRMAKYYLFEFNDGFTRNRFVGTIKPFLEGVKAGRGVYDFYVRCDETNNTPAVIDANQFVCDIAIKPTRVAEFITLNFVAVGTGVEFSEIFV